MMRAVARSARALGMVAGSSGCRSATRVQAVCRFRDRGGRKCSRRRSCSPTSAPCCPRCTKRSNSRRRSLRSRPGATPGLPGASLRHVAHAVLQRDRTVGRRREAVRGHEPELPGATLRHVAHAVLRRGTPSSRAGSASDGHDPELPGAILRHVADAVLRATERRRRRERVRRARRRAPGANLCQVAHAVLRPTDCVAAGAQSASDRAGRRRSRAILRHVAGPRPGPTDRRRRCRTRRVGQVDELPVHFSATSQVLTAHATTGPSSKRRRRPPDRSTSVPVQFSADVAGRSPRPTDRRRRRESRPPGRRTRCRCISPPRRRCWSLPGRPSTTTRTRRSGRLAEVPVQVSATSQVLRRRPADRRRRRQRVGRAGRRGAGAVLGHVAGARRRPADRRRRGEARQRGSRATFRCRSRPRRTSPFEARQTRPGGDRRAGARPCRPDCRTSRRPCRRVLQQMPLTQVSPDAHWLVAPQTPPWAWNPQPPLAQIPGQLWWPTLAQLPAPSHFAAGVSVVGRIAVRAGGRLALRPRGPLRALPGVALPGRAAGRLILQARTSPAGPSWP